PLLYPPPLHDALPIYGDHRRQGHACACHRHLAGTADDRSSEIRLRCPLRGLVLVAAAQLAVVYPVGGRHWPDGLIGLGNAATGRSEEHTSELQSRENL